LLWLKAQKRSKTLLSTNECIEKIEESQRVSVYGLFTVKLRKGTRPKQGLGRFHQGVW